MRFRTDPNGERVFVTFIGEMCFLLPVLSRNSKQTWGFKGSNVYIRDWSAT